MTTRRVLAATIGVLLCAVCLSADESSVQADPKTDFSALKTFALRDGKIDSPRPELDNPLFVKKLGKMIRAGLLAKGLKETTARADVVVDFSIAGEDFGRTARPFRGARTPVRFTEGTLVIDMFKSGDPEPIWRGVYTGAEKTGSKLMQKLPGDATKLLSKYPRLTK